MSILKKYKTETFSALSRLASESMKEGALSVKIKELLAVALSIAVHCEPCIKIHLRRALEAGTTEEEIAETLGVTVLMCGGPADVWPVRIIEEELQRGKAPD